LKAIRAAACNRLDEAERRKRQKIRGVLLFTKPSVKTILIWVGNNVVIVSLSPPMITSSSAKIDRDV